MERWNKQEQGNKKVTKIKTFPVPFTLGEIKKSISISTNTPTKPSKEQIIKQALRYHSQGNISEASKYYKYFLDQGFNDPRVLSNYAILCRRQGKLDLAKKLYLKSINLYQSYSDSYSNLGYLLKEEDNLKESIKYIRKAIDIKPNNVEAHLNLG